MPLPATCRLKQKKKEKDSKKEVNINHVKPDADIDQLS
jgi:hypothetical protein